MLFEHLRPVSKRSIDVSDDLPQLGSPKLATGTEGKTRSGGGSWGAREQLTRVGPFSLLFYLFFYCFSIVFFIVFPLFFHCFSFFIFFFSFCLFVFFHCFSIIFPLFFYCFFSLCFFVFFLSYFSFRGQAVACRCVVPWLGRSRLCCTGGYRRWRVRCRCRRCVRR